MSDISDIRVILAIASIAAACGGEGVALQITSEEPIDRVELFVVSEECSGDDISCMTGVGWDTHLTPPAGDVRYMLDDKVIETTLFDGDSTAVLSLEVASEAFQPQAIALVGFREGQPVAATMLKNVRVPTSRQEIWHVHLSQAGSVADPRLPPSTDGEVRVHRWPRRNHEIGHAGCLVFQLWDADRMQWQSHYFVPKSDPDCDDQPVECDAHWFDRNVGEIASCVTDTTVGVPGGCMVGTMPCSDGTSSSTSCQRDPERSNICLADVLCDKCSDSASVEACAIAEVTSNSSLVAYECELTPDATATEGPCTQSGNTVALELPGGCIGGTLHEADDPLGVKPSTATVMLGDVTIVFSFFDDGSRCHVGLTWVEGASVMNPGGYIVVDVWYAERHVLLPVEITFATPQPQCGSSVKTPCEPRGTWGDAVAQGCQI
jgi:hypothetical protein